MRIKPITRPHYWSNSAVSDFLYKKVNVKKPHSLSMNDWKMWHETTKQEHPIMYFINEEALGVFQDIVMFPIDLYKRIKFVIRNRYISHSHCMCSTTLEKGVYHDFRDKMLHCLFDELVDFVEIEKGLMNIAWNSDGCRYKKSIFPWKWSSRYKEDGIAYLQWEMSLEDCPDQANAASIQFYLYTWWTVTRPQREDPHQSSGWDIWCDQHPAFSDLSDEDRSKQSVILKNLQKIEEAYDAEDQEMLHRLIDIRMSCWT